MIKKISSHFGTIIVTLLVPLAANPNGARAESVGETNSPNPPLTQAERLSQSVLESCVKTVEGPRCQQYYRENPSLSNLNPALDLRRKCGPASTERTLAILESCARGGVGAIKDIFAAARLSPTGEAFVDLRKRCFADAKCRQEAYTLGKQAYYKGQSPTPAELSTLTAAPASDWQSYSYQPFYYGILVQLKKYQMTEMRLVAEGLEPGSEEFDQSMKLEFPDWKPADRQLYVQSSLIENAWRAFKSLPREFDQLRTKLDCLSDETLMEYLCYGGASLATPAVGLKAATLSLRAANALQKWPRLARLVASSESALAETAPQAFTGELAKGVSSRLQVVIENPTQDLKLQESLSTLRKNLGDHDVVLTQIDKEMVADPMFKKLITGNVETAWDAKTGKSLGTAHYTLDNKGTLYVQSFESEIKEIGVNRYLFRSILARNPNVKKIVSSVAKDNAEILNKARKEMGLSCQEAVKLTPAYKIQAALGFTKIVEFACWETSYKDEYPLLILSRE